MPHTLPGHSHSFWQARWFQGCVAAPAGCLLLAAAILIGVYVAHNAPVDMHPPVPTLPVPNAYDDFALASSQIAGIKHFTALASRRGQILRGRQLEAAIHEAAPILAIVRRGLQEQCVVPPDRGFAGLPSTLQSYANRRALGRILADVSRYWESQRQFTRAAEVALDGMEMFQMLNNGSSVMGALVNCAAYSICSEELRRILDRVPPRDLPLIAARLDRIRRKVVPFADIVIQEGWVMVELDRYAFAGVANPRTLVDTITQLAGATTRRAPAPEEILKAASFALADKQKLLERHLQYFRDVAAETRGPFTGTIRTPPPTDVLGRYLAVPPKTWAAYLRTVADLDLLRVCVAVLRYRADHGAYPAELQALVPRYLAALPGDPFGGSPGAPFHYRTEPPPGNFLLYSPGPALAHDEGQSARLQQIVIHPYKEVR